MGSIVLYAVFTLWVAVMGLAVAAPFFTKPSASVSPNAPAIPFRQPPTPAAGHDTSEDRAAA